jgi:acetylglutamate kinase
MDEKELKTALEYIGKFKDQIFLIKLSGEILSDSNALESVASDLVLLHRFGIHPVIIHGAGKQISSNMEKLGLKPAFIRGERVTDETTLGIVIGALYTVNDAIVGKINKSSKLAVGIGGLFDAQIKSKELGLVGKVTAVNHKVVLDLIASGYIPVIIAIGRDHLGRSLNINADRAAAALAKALKAGKVMLLTNVDGVLDKNGKLIKELDVDTAKSLLNTNAVTNGMIPKIDSSIEMISEGVKEVHIVKAGEGVILAELLTDKGKGTMITK